MMEIAPDLSHVTQFFGGNANPIYNGIGLKGHPGFDEVYGYGTDIHSYVNGVVYEVYPIAGPAADGYTGIFCIVDSQFEVYEWIVGHMSRIDIDKEQQVTKGQIIGAEGNHGPVYSGGIQITLAMQQAGDKRGSHRHNQKRPCIRVTHTEPGKTYLQARFASPYRDHDGFYYEVYDPANGYAGCTDPLTSVFKRDLTVGMSGYDVFILQKILASEGCAPFAPTGYMGLLTKAALAKTQQKYGIEPTAGYLGPKSRLFLQQKYSV